MTTDTRKSAVTSFDVAREAGVSRASVSRAFTPGAPISPKLRDHVLQVADRLGYRVNQFARGLNRQRSDLVGIIVSRLDNPYRSAQVEALAKELAANDLRPMLFCIEPGVRVDTTLRLLLEYQVAGVIVTSRSPPDQIAEECAKKGVPLILVDRDEQHEAVDHLRGDNVTGGALVAEAFQAVGRRRVIAIHPTPMAHAVKDRLQGFEDRAQALGLTLTQWPMTGYDYPGGYAMATDLAGSGLARDGSTGIFCPNDVSALGCLDGLRRAGLAVPEELGLMGYDNIPQAGWDGAQLSTIQQCPKEFARTIARLIISRIDTPDSARRQITLPVKPVLRATH